MLRPGNVHSARNWREVLEPILARYERTRVRRYFRADAAFPRPEVYEYLEERRVLHASVPQLRRPWIEHACLLRGLRGYHRGLHRGHRVGTRFYRETHWPTQRLSKHRLNRTSANGSPGYSLAMFLRSVMYW